MLKALVLVFVISAIWKEFYTGTDLIAGFTLAQAIAYTCMATSLTLLFEVNLESFIGTKVRDGSVSMELIKPINYFSYVFFDRLGQACYSMLFSVVPALLILILLFDLSAFEPANLLVGLSWIFLGYLLFYLISHISALATFITEDAWGVTYLRTTFVRFFAGGFIPLAFFPEALQAVNAFLPFQYMIYIPACALVGKLPEASFWKVIGVQLLWIFVLFVIDFLFWKIILKRITVHGG